MWRYNHFEDSTTLRLFRVSRKQPGDLTFPKFQEKYTSLKQEADWWFFFVERSKFYRPVLTPIVCYRLKRIALSGIKDVPLINIFIKIIASTVTCLEYLDVSRCDSSKAFEIDSHSLERFGISKHPRPEGFWLRFCYFLMHAKSLEIVDLVFNTPVSKALAKHLITSFCRATSLRAYSFYDDCKAITVISNELERGQIIRLSSDFQRNTARIMIH